VGFLGDSFSEHSRLYALRPQPTRTNHRPGTGAVDDYDLYAFIGIAVTSATVVIYGTAISDPVQLLSRFHSPVAVVISLIAILLATLSQHRSQRRVSGK